MTLFSELVERNSEYAKTKHRPKLYLTESTAPPPPLLIFSCVDFRVIAEEILDLKEGEAFVVRNGGGRVKSSFDTLLFLDQFTQERVIKEVVVIHHTDCGKTSTTDRAIKDNLKLKLPHLESDIERYDFETYDGSDISKHEESIREDLNFLKASPFLRDEIKDNVKGFVYDIKTGRLHSVI